jgi:signal transduction histidine kinase/ActR/RegA family two-component response regulator
MTFMVSPEDSWSGRVKNRRRDGRPYIADTRIFPLYDAKRRPSNLVCIKIDVTTQVQLESQLQHAQKMEAIGTLAGGIAHDFNNILGGILGFTELSLRQTPGDERLKRNLNRIVDGCQRAKELIHHILTFSRKQDDQLQPLELQLVLKEALKLLRATIPTSIEFRLHIAKEPCIVRSTPTLIHQIVMNLCTNAAQAMDIGGGLLEVKLEKVELKPMEIKGAGGLSGPFARLIVSDSGKGIDAATLPRIFEPYFTTKASTGGTGLGLSTVHGIVKNMGGAIEVTSEPGSGTSFEIYLPRMDDLVVATAPENFISPQGGKERILVVDDEIAILEILREMLEDLGYRVETAEAGDAVLHRLRRHPDSFDLVITDWVMPKMNGRQLAEQIMLLNPNLPIILATGTDVAGQFGSEALSLFRAMLLKPVKYNDLAQTVRQVLDQSANRPGSGSK